MITKKFADFIVLLVKKCNQDEVFARAGELSYSLILSIFPLLIFIMSILGFLNLEIDSFLIQVQDVLPDQIISLFEIFDSEVLSQRNVSLLSTSLLFSVFNSSAGFMGIIRGINKSYGNKDSRGAIRLRLLSVGLVLIFAAAIIGCVATVIFQDRFSAFITNYFALPEYSSSIFGAVSTFFIFAVIVTTVMLIYKLSNSVKQTILNVMPGAVVSVVFWVVSSMGFKFYISNFARYSLIYGSIGSVIVLLLWLNIASIVLLVGNEVNALMTANGRGREDEISGA